MKMKKTETKPKGPTIRQLVRLFVTRYRIVSTGRKTFYEWNGKCWKACEEGYIEHLIECLVPDVRSTSRRGKPRPICSGIGLVRRAFMNSRPARRRPARLLRKA